jgi:hypothetical protein
LKGQRICLIDPADGSRKTGPDKKSILPEAGNDAAPAGSLGRWNGISISDGKKQHSLKTEFVGKRY